MFIFKKKIKYICIVMSVLMLTLLGCSNTNVTESTDEASEDDVIEIGMCFDSFVIERWERDRDIFVSTARDLGAEVNVQNANGDVDEQIKQIEYFIDKDVDAIVVISVDGTALSDVVKKAQNKGIKVISYDRLIPDAGTDLYISFDNTKVGEIMAEALIKKGLPGKKVLMLQGPVTDNNVIMVYDGFTSVMESKGIEIVDKMNADGWKAELAADYIYDHPEVIDEVDGIMCGNDSIATAVIRVLSEKRKAGKISVVGQDAELEACQRIVEGTQLMTVYKPVDRIAQRAAEATVSLIKGDELTDAVTMSDGSHDINAIVLEPVAVTKENMDSTIIGSGFHLREDVYLNVK